MPVQNGVFRFGSFEADLGASELRRNGIRLKLQSQPFRVLALLLQHPGQILTREELQQDLWPSGTFVARRDFEVDLARCLPYAVRSLEANAEPAYRHQRLRAPPYGRSRFTLCRVGCFHQPAARFFSSTSCSSISISVPIMPSRAS